MAYIGKKVEETELANRTVDTMTGDGSDTTMSLSATPISVNNVLVFFNGVMQRPTTDFTLSGSTITFAAAPFTGAVVVAITGEGGHIGRPSSPLPTEKFMDSAITNAKLMSGIASSKLTGAMPALDGSALTGGGTGYTESTNDPVITTNPSTGVGTFWVNKSSGEVYCCTDATAGSNVWINIGGGSGDIEPYTFAAVGDRGLFGGGRTASLVNNIDYVSISTTGNASDFGNLTVSRYDSGTASNGSRGVWYAGSGFASTRFNTIDYVTIATTGNATNFGTATSARNCAENGASNITRGIFFAGDIAGSNINNIDYITIATTGNGVDFGDCISATRNGAAVGSDTRACFGGGGDPARNQIQYVTIATTGNAIDFGDVTTTSYHFAACSDGLRGVWSGGYRPASSNIMDYVTIATTGNATDFGDLTVARTEHGGAASPIRGMFCGGSGNVITMDYFTVQTVGNATDFGDLVVGRRGANGLSGD